MEYVIHYVFLIAVGSFLDINRNSTSHQLGYLICMYVYWHAIKQSISQSTLKFTIINLKSKFKKKFNYRKLLNKIMGYN